MADYYMVRIDGSKIVWVDSTFRDEKQIGITEIAAKQIEDALSDVITQRDEYYQMLIDNKILEKPKDPKEIAIEALEEARLARQESANMAAQLAESNAMLHRILAHTCSCSTVTTDVTPVPVSVPPIQGEVAEQVIEIEQETHNKHDGHKGKGGKHGNRI